MENKSDWEMPSEAEMKVILARKERSNKISSLMGAYLLKNYKMLSTTCNNCDTILLQDKRGILHCVACEEIDSLESAKDEPTLSEVAARRQAEESHFSEANMSSETNAEEDVASAMRFAATNTTQSNPRPSMSNSDHNGSFGTNCTSSGVANKAVCHSTQRAHGSEDSDSDDNGHPDEPMQIVPPALKEVKLNSDEESFGSHAIIVEEKLEWACKQLKSSKNVAKCIELSSLVKSCAETLVALREAQQSYGQKAKKPRRNMDDH